MKKTLSTLTSLVLLLAFNSCKEDFEAPSSTPSNIHVTTGFGTGTPVVQINGSETFADLSAGVKSRKWTFPGGDVTDIETSSEQIVNATFFKTGTYEVLLNHSFQSDPFDWRTQTFSGSKENDSTITVTVVDSVRASMRVFYIAEDGSDSTELTLASGARNQLMAGESIRIKQSSGGAPAIFEWESEGASPSFVQSLDPDELVEIKYKRLGSYDLAFRPYRTKPIGGDLLVLEDFIEVIPSTKPVLLEDVYRYNSTTVALAYSRTISDPSNEEGNFTVRAKNDGVRDDLGIPQPFDENLPIELVSVGSGEEDNLILLSLGDNIYSSDTVWVSYAGGEIKSSDGIPADEFTEAVLDFKLPNISEQYGGFENEGEGWIQYQQFNDDGSIEYRTEAGYGEFAFSTEKPHSGEYSLRLSTTRNADLVPQWIEVVVDVDLSDPDAALAYNSVSVTEGDRFYISYWAFVESAQPVSPDVWEASSFYLWLMWDKLKILEYREGVATHPMGEWVKVEGIWGGLNGATGEAVLRPYFRSIGNITIFLDDLEIYEYETRPYGG